MWYVASVHMNIYIYIAHIAHYAWRVTFAPVGQTAGASSSNNKNNKNNNNKSPVKLYRMTALAHAFRTIYGRATQRSRVRPIIIQRDKVGFYPIEASIRHRLASTIAYAHARSGGLCKTDPIAELRTANCTRRSARSD